MLEAAPIKKALPGQVPHCIRSYRRLGRAARLGFVLTGPPVRMHIAVPAPSARPRAIRNGESNLRLSRSKKLLRYSLPAKIL